MNHKTQEEQGYPENTIMENKNKQTIIPLQLPEDMQEEMEELRKQIFPEKTEEEWCSFVVQAGLATIKIKETEK